MIIALIKVVHLFFSFRPPNCWSYDLLKQMKSDGHSINDELIIKLWWCELAYLHFQIVTTFKFTQCLFLFAKLLKYCKLVCNSTLWSNKLIKNVFSNFANKNKHCVNLNVVTIWKCKYASSHHHNLMINSSLILWPSDFICFSKSYDQQFGGLKEKNKWTTLMRAIIIKQYYHYKFNLELNI